uniref:Ovule protein n=1 Tax=Panagrellus redivivus TaxID=6233 RepID=A0A7E4UQP9_PANRE
MSKSRKCLRVGLLPKTIKQYKRTANSALKCMESSRTLNSKSRVEASPNMKGIFSKVSSGTGTATPPTPSRGYYTIIPSEQHYCQQKSGVVAPHNQRRRGRKGPFRRGERRPTLGCS